MRSHSIRHGSKRLRFFQETDMALAPGLAEEWGMRLKYQAALDEAGMDMTAEEYYELRAEGGSEYEDIRWQDLQQHLLNLGFELLSPLLRFRSRCSCSSESAVRQIEEGRMFPDLANTSVGKWW